MRVGRPYCCMHCLFAADGTIENMEQKLSVRVV